MAFRLQPLVRPTCRALAAAAQPGTMTTTTAMSHLMLPVRGPAAFPAQVVRQKRTMTRAEEEDLQGIPVRLLRDIKGFGRRHAIIRVKPGRMRNVWHHKGQAEYMTKERFAELGLTEASIGVRDRSFGTQLLLADDDKTAAEKRARKLVEAGGATPNKKKESVTFNAIESRALLDDLLPPILTFVRKPIATPEPVAPPPPAAPRSPALAANAITSSEARGGAPEPPAEPEKPAAAAAAIFGSVAAPDVLAAVRDALLADQHGNRVALEAEGIALRGLAPGEDRIKHLGRYEVDIVTGRDVEPVRRVVEVVAPEDPKAAAQ